MQLEELRKLFELAKEFNVHSFKDANIEVVFKVHSSQEPLSEEVSFPIPTPPPLTEDEILFYSSDVQDDPKE